MKNNLKKSIRALCAWLNDEFMKDAFGDGETALVKSTTVKADKNQ